jgi:two-component sensor histidine kinase
LLTKDSNLEQGVVEESETKENKYIAPYSIIDVIESKKYQDQGKNDIDIKFNPDEDNKFVFIRGNFVDFSRMMSNLINNGVDGIGKKGGRIEVSYKVKGEEVEIVVKDNGNGMPGSMVEKINRGEAVGTTKENGHGIGMEQILKTVRELEGKLEVKSKEGEGTEFILKFLKCENPKWFADKMEIKKGSTVVVLDDDIETHEMWKEKFKVYEKEIEVKYFTKVMEAIEFINSMEDKDKVLLLTEYEIKGERINGVEVIEKTKTQDKHILVTNKYLSDIEEFKEKNGFLKICHKMYINDIPFAVV